MRRAWLAVAGAALGAALAVPLLGAPATASAATGPRRRPRPRRGPTPGGAGGVRHVVIIGISGLRWNQVTAAGTPELWRLADGGSVGSLVDYAQQPLSCPADGWLTLNAAARAQGPRPCPSLPEVVGDGRRGQRSRDGADHRGQPGLPRVARLGTARLAGELRDRRRPRRGPRAGDPGRGGPLVPAVGGGTVGGGAGPLPADRGRPGPNRRYRTDRCLRDRPPASRDRGRTARRHPAPGHLPWRRGNGRSGRRADRASRT